MKILILLFFTIAASRADDYVLTIEDLEVPADPSSWIFKGNDSDVKRDGRISFGNTASNTKFPWVAELRINSNTGGFLCSASLISSKWLVGARHCIADMRINSMLALMGSADRQAARVQVFSDQQIYMNSNTGTNHPDIAVFRLSVAVAFNSFVKAVNLPSRSHVGRTYEGQTITAIGWGRVAGNVLSRYLQWTQFTVLPLSQCNYGIYMCSRPCIGFSSLEGGDSGGPSVIYEGGIPTLVGVNVFYTTSLSGRKQGSTRVNLFLDFINRATGIPV